MFPHIFWGEMLRHLRESRGLLQKEVAVTLHESRQCYSNMEVGRTHPSPEHIFALSIIYDVDLMQYIRHCLPDELMAELRSMRSHATDCLLEEQKKKQDETSSEAAPPKKKGRKQRTVIRKAPDESALYPLQFQKGETAAEPAAWRNPRAKKPQKTD